VARSPDGIVLRRHRDFEGRGHEPWIRRALLLLVAALPVLALANVFGQRPTTAEARAPAAVLRLSAPTSLRGGLLFQARFDIRAHRELKRAQLVLQPGWLEGFTLNTVAPSPIGEASDNRRLVFTLGHVPAGSTYRLYLQFQVNPTNVGSHRQDVELLDGDRHVALLRRTVTVFP
jgi:hypothetical protein